MQVEKDEQSRMTITGSNNNHQSFGDCVPVPDGKHNHINWDHPARGLVKIVDKERSIVEELNPVTKEKRTKVALVGYAESTRHLAPYHDPEWSVWGVNQLNRFIPRADRWFEMHRAWNTHVVEGTDYAGFLRNLPIPVYMSYPDQTIPNALAYPKGKIVGALKLEYLTSTIAEMLCLAIYEGFTTIGLFGIDLAVNEEWAYQKPCAEFWLGFAHARGIRLVLPQRTALLKSRFSYGYTADDYVPVPTQSIEKNILKYKAKLIELQGKAQAVDGAIQMMETFLYAQKLWEHGGDSTFLNE